VTLFDYDKIGNLVKTTYPDTNVVTSRTYNKQNQLISQTNPLQNSTTFTYDNAGNLSQITDAENRITQYSYDKNNRKIKKTILNAESDQTETWVYGELGTPFAGRLIEKHFPTYWQELKYDTRGRITRRINHLEGNKTQTTQYSYDAAGNLEKTLDAKERATTYTFDALGRQTQVTTPDLKNTLTTYDNRDNVLTVTDPNGHTIRTYTYDRSNRKLTESRPLGNSEITTYDNSGRVATTTDAKGQKSQYTYNDAGELSQIERFASASNTPAKTLQFTYNNLGLLKSYNDGSTSATYEYDLASQKTKETTHYGSFSLSHQYTYYKNGLKKTYTTPENTPISYLYNAVNQLSLLTIPNQGNITIQEYEWTAPKKILLPGGQTRKIIRDALLQPIYIESRKGITNEVLFERSYIYDEVNNIISKTDAEGSSAYAYDDLDRLLTVDNANSSDEGFTYDFVGNRLTSQETTGQWQYNSNNELQGFDTTHFVHDDNGAITQIKINEEVTYYDFNVENRLSKIRNSGGTIAEYTYSPFGKRLTKKVGNTTTTFYYTDEGLVGEYDNQGKLIQGYGYAPNGLYTTDPLYTYTQTDYAYYITDNLGTPQQLINVNGDVVWQADYKAFGEVDIQTDFFNNPLRFPGQYEDKESGLYYNFHRYYSPSLGSYLNKDPIGLGGGINEFGYSDQNPIISADPLALFSFCVNLSLPSYAKFGGCPTEQYDSNSNQNNDPQKKCFNKEHCYKQNLANFEMCLQQSNCSEAVRKKTWECFRKKLWGIYWCMLFEGAVCAKSCVGSGLKEVSNCNQKKSINGYKYGKNYGENLNPPICGCYSYPDSPSIGVGMPPQDNSVLKPYKKNNPNF
jgi:RHS repeat-associated protein